MEESKTTPIQAKILEALELVYDKLVEHKKKIKGEIVVMKDGKIVKIKF